MSPAGMMLATLVLPFVSAGLVMIGAGWLGRRLGIERADHAAAALAVGVGYVVGHAAIASPTFPPLDVTDRIPWLAGLAAILGILESIWPGPSWTLWENRLLLTALVLSALLGPLFAESSENRPSTVCLVVYGLIALASWTNLSGLADRLSGARLGVPLLTVGFGIAIALVVSGSLALGQLSAVLAAAVAAMVLLKLGSPMLLGTVPVMVATFGALLLNSFIYAALPASAAVALVSAPAAFWVSRLGRMERLATWKVVLVTEFATLIPVGIALALAFSASPGYAE